MKTKFLAMIGGLGGLCVLCCTLSLFGVLGFATIEAFVCENQTLQLIGGRRCDRFFIFYYKKTMATNEEISQHLRNKLWV